MTTTSRRLPVSRLTTRLGACVGAAALVGAVAALPASAAGADPEHLGSAADLGVAAPTETEPRPAISGRWFVEVEGDPAAQGGSVATAATTQDAVVAEAADAGVELEVRESFTTTWNGLSVEVADEDVDTLRELPGVVEVHPVFAVPMPDEPVAAPELSSALAMTGADVAQSELGFTGAGVKVGVIDSGIDYNHVDLGGGGTDDDGEFPTARVGYGYDFVGDDYDAGATGPAATPQPDPLPDDCGGHGTHVAGIVGAAGNPAENGVVGVAPEATLGAYRVFGCDGSSDTEVILAAMEMAADDGMDVVNMSLGAAFMTWPTYPTALAADAMVDDGVVVVVSQGNEGEAGTFSGGAPAVGSKTISVASFENTTITAPAFVLDSGERIGYANATGAPLAPTEGTLPVTAAGPHPEESPIPEGSPVLGCTPTEGAEGSALLVSRGVCSFHEKAVAAQESGAAALIIYNNVPGAISATVEGAVEITIPVVTVSLEDGLVLQGALADGSATMTWTPETVQTVNPNGGLVSGFSSYGLAADLTLKPDLGAPGGQIYSTYPIEEGGHRSVSGTSMAAPHVAGAVALLLEARPDLEPLEVRDLLQNSADPQTWSGIPDAGLLEPVHRQGAGLLDIDDAILARTTVTPGKISLGESEEERRRDRDDRDNDRDRGRDRDDRGRGWERDRDDRDRDGRDGRTTLRVTNHSDADVTYEISASHGVATAGSTLVPEFFGAEATVEAPGSVTVRAGRTARVEVEITAPEPESLVGLVYGGWITLTAEDDRLVVPFAGLAGDYQDVPVFTDYVGTALPSLGRAVDGALVLAGPGATYTMAGDDVPYFVYRLEYPVSDLRLSVFHARADGSKGRAVHRYNTFLTTGELGRSAMLDFVSWDGTLTQERRGHDKVRTVRDGSYVVEITALKALGDPRNRDHLETWTSPAFTIDRADEGPGHGRS
ncbi:S8 family serine peptidase [Georgenia subflava]|uniref:S8 family serine peptidase n=1 Tax=Georgenia subflava TaxID=1622177 RepID=A0A6N7EJC2_9MICO|nr:S8 family serine peptidase [Georgenia subflava]MPV37531.1 S8 family serine peptidase [Georgenia subflava]